MCTYLSTLLTRGHRHIKIPHETNPCVGVVFDRRNLTCPPVKEFVVDDLLHSPYTLYIYIMVERRKYALVLSLVG